MKKNVTIPYIKRTRKHKKRAYIALKNSIKDNIFSSHHEFSEHTQWADIYFFGKNKIIYNATIHTTNCKWYDLVHDKAWQELREKAPNEKYFEIVDVEDKFTSKGYRTTTISDPPLAKLNGLTASEFLKKTEIEIGQNKTLTVNEYFKILHGFGYGVGLDISIHVPYLTKENIKEAIEKFISLGEKDWTGKEQYYFDYKENINFTTNSVVLD